MKSIRAHWVVGIILAAVGVILARVVSGRFADQAGIQLALFFGGVTLALAGLGVILFGMRRVGK